MNGFIIQVPITNSKIFSTGLKLSGEKVRSDNSENFIYLFNKNTIELKLALIDFNNYNFNGDLI